MKHIVCAAAMLLAGCVSAPAPTSAVQPIGPSTFSVSQRNVPFGSPAAVAGSFCGQFGQRVQIEGTSTEQTIWSDQVYSVLIFRCVTAEPR